MPTRDHAPNKRSKLAPLIKVRKSFRDPIEYCAIRPDTADKVPDHTGIGLPKYFLIESMSAAGSIVVKCGCTRTSEHVAASLGSSTTSTDSFIGLFAMPSIRLHSVVSAISLT